MRRRRAAVMLRVGPFVFQRGRVTRRRRGARATAGVALTSALRSQRASEPVRSWRPRRSGGKSGYYGTFRFIASGPKLAVLRCKGAAGASSSEAHRPRLRAAREIHILKMPAVAASPSKELSPAACDGVAQSGGSAWAA